MLHYSEEATRFLGAATSAEVAADRCTFLAIALCIQRVGGAANQVAEEARADMADINWHALTAMRDRPAKEYRTVTPELVVEIVRNEFPPLIASLRRVLEK
jgi:uncharacterized protein with HEPN domain